ncbi:M20/M25/M40 family metallo-hydrolase [Thaumasiovibrio subtropicus]|uniref:M20/M25/M40 family metallo-hydrolase n=1 Tax=Thaumasiovibrio subtropicus TaxID=1891207 RepID=UPI000B35D47A|nr:M20/M25/M40 family metallo-hydrolase [Thaumasiovibrio subtropicus]
MSNINQERLVNHFIDIVKIDSESGNEKAIAEALAEQLGQIGFSVEKLPVPETLSNGFNIYAKLPGELDGSVALSCHMDTVTPGIGIEPVIDGDIISTAGETVLGGDDKSGIAAIMEAVRAIKADGKPHQTIELAFTVYEEGGLHGSQHYDMGKLESEDCIVFDSGGEIGTIITVAPGQQNMKVTIKGRPAHAGLAPEEGINALTVASDAIMNMKLSRIDEETTANIGVVKGGLATNIVMPELYIEAEARSLNDDKLAAQVAHMVSEFEAAAERHGAEIEIVSSRAYNAFRIEDNDPLVQKVMAAFDRNGISPFTAPTGGGSDANIFNGHGLKTINLSTGMAKVHTTEEFIKISDMVKITDFLYTYLTH